MTKSKFHKFEAFLVDSNEIEAFAARICRGCDLARFTVKIAAKDGLTAVASSDGIGQGERGALNDLRVNPSEISTVALSHIAGARHSYKIIKFVA
jgi:hypothetical protein